MVPLTRFFCRNDHGNVSKDEIVLILPTLLMLIFLLMLPEPGWAAGQVNHDRYFAACNNLLGFIEGPFGALITVGAGIGAIISSSVGGFKTAWTLVVVSVGAFILRAWVTLFFAACFTPPTLGNMG